MAAERRQRIGTQDCRRSGDRCDGGRVHHRHGRMTLDGLRNRDDGRALRRLRRGGCRLTTAVDRECAWLRRRRVHGEARGRLSRLGGRYRRRGGDRGGRRGGGRRLHRRGRNRCRDGNRGDGLRDRRGRRCARACRQQRRRVDVALGLGGDTNTEMDVRLRMLAVATRAEPADDRAFVDGRAARDGDRTEVRQSHGVAVVGRDRQRQTRSWDGARERDEAGARCEHGRARGAGDVDAAMLATGVRMRSVEDEWLEDFAVGRPRPRPCCRSADHRRRGHEQEHATHRTPP